MLDMVVASDGAGKTLQLVNDYIDVSRYNSIFIVDDGSHRVWCLQFAAEIRSNPKFVLIAPQRFDAWLRIKALTVMYAHMHDKLGYASMIRRYIMTDHFFVSFQKFLTFFVSAEHRQNESDIIGELVSHSISWEQGGNQTETWWNWNVTAWS